MGQFSVKISAIPGQVSLEINTNGIIAVAVIVSQPD